VNIGDHTKGFSTFNLLIFI